MKRKIELSDDTDTIKKQKHDEIIGVSDNVQTQEIIQEDATNEKDYTEEISSFKQGLIGEETEINTLRDFVKIGRSDIKIAECFLTTSPECKELFDLLNTSQRPDPQKLAYIWEIFELVLTHLSKAKTSGGGTSSANGSFIAGKLLQNHVKLFYFSMGVGSSAHLVTAVLKCMSAMLAQGHWTVREFVVAFDFSLKGLKYQAKKRIKKQQNDPRVCFVRFMLAFFVFGDVTTLFKTLEEKGADDFKVFNGLVGTIFNELYQDANHVVVAVLRTFYDNVINDNSILKKGKVLLFNNFVLSKLVFLTKNNDEEIRSLALSSLRVLCSDYKKGICFKNPDHTKLVNPVLLRFITGFKLQAQTSNELFDITMATLQACPDILATYVSSVDLQMEPRPTDVWMQRIDFAVKLFKQLPSIDGSSIESSKESTLKTILPNISKRLFEAGVKSTVFSVTSRCLQLLQVTLERSVDLKSLLFKHVKSEIVNYWIEEIFHSIPSPMALIKTRQSCIASNGENNKESFDANESTLLLKGCMECLLMYQQLKPGVVSDAGYNICKFIVDDEKHVPTSLQIMSLEGETIATWLDKKIAGYKSFLHILIEVVFKLRDDNTNVSIGKQLFFKVLNSSGQFEDESFPVEVWLCHLLHHGDKEACLQFADTCLQLINNPFPQNPFDEMQCDPLLQSPLVLMLLNSELSNGKCSEIFVSVLQSLILFTKTPLKLDDNQLLKPAQDFSEAFIKARNQANAKFPELNKECTAMDRLYSAAISPSSTYFTAACDDLVTQITTNHLYASPCLTLLCTVVKIVGIKAVPCQFVALLEAILPHVTYDKVEAELEPLIDEILSFKWFDFSAALLKHLHQCFPSNIKFTKLMVDKLKGKIVKSVKQKEDTNVTHFMGFLLKITTLLPKELLHKLITVLIYENISSKYETLTKALTCQISLAIEHNLLEGFKLESRVFISALDVTINNQSLAWCDLLEKLVEFTGSQVEYSKLVSVESPSLMRVLRNKCVKWKEEVMKDLSEGKFVLSLLAVYCEEEPEDSHFGEEVVRKFKEFLEHLESEDCCTILLHVCHLFTTKLKNRLAKLSVNHILDNKQLLPLLVKIAPDVPSKYLLKATERLLTANSTEGLLPDLMSTLTSDDDDALLQASLKQAWNGYVKNTLKSHFEDSCVMKVFAQSVQQLYKLDWFVQGKVIPAKDIFFMVCGHSRFFPIVCSAEHSPEKNGIVLLLKALVEKDEKLCKDNFLPVLMTAYQCSLSLSDQNIFLLLRIFEKNNVRMRFPFLWGSSAKLSFQTKKETLVDGTNSLEELFKLLDTKKILNTVVHFPVDLTINGQECENDDIYDPRFLLNILNAILSQDTDVDCRLVIESGLLSLSFASLTSSDEGIRSLGYSCISKYNSRLEGARFKERNQVTYMLLLVKNSIEELCMRIPTVWAAMFSQYLYFVLRPAHHMYPILNNQLLMRPVVNFREMSFFPPLYHTWRDWLITLLRGGVKQAQDYYLYKRHHVYEMLMAHYDFSTSQSKDMILSLLESTCKIESAAYDLTKTHALIGWIHFHVTSGEKLERHFNLLQQLVHTLSNHPPKLFANEVLLIISSLTSDTKSIMKSKIESLHASVNLIEPCFKWDTNTTKVVKSVPLTPSYRVEMVSSKT